MSVAENAGIDAALTATAALRSEILNEQIAGVDLVRKGDSLGVGFSYKRKRDKEVYGDLFAAMISLLVDTKDYGLVSALLTSLVNMININQTLARVLFHSGNGGGRALVVLLGVLKLFPEESSFNMCVIQILFVVVELERKAVLIFRLENGFQRLQLVMAHFRSNTRLMKACLQFTSLLLKRGGDSCVGSVIKTETMVVAYISVLKQCVGKRSIKGKTIMFHTLSILERLWTVKQKANLDKLFLQSIVPGNIDFVAWLVQLLSVHGSAGRLDAPVTVACLRILRNVARLSGGRGLAKITKAGGFDALVLGVWPHVQDALVSKTANSLLFFLHKKLYGGVNKPGGPVVHKAEPTDAKLEAAESEGLLSTASNIPQRDMPESVADASSVMPPPIPHPYPFTNFGYKCEMSHCLLNFPQLYYSSSAPSLAALLQLKEENTLLGVESGDSVARIAACVNDWKLNDFCPEFWPISSQRIKDESQQLRAMPIRSLRCFTGKGPVVPVSVTYPTEAHTGCMMLEPLFSARAGLQLELMNASTDRFRNANVDPVVVFDLDELPYDEQSAVSKSWAPSFARTLLGEEQRQSEKDFDGAVAALLSEHGEGNMEEPDNDNDGGNSSEGGGDPEGDEDDGEDAADEDDGVDSKAPEAFSVTITTKKKKSVKRKKHVPVLPIKVIGLADDDDEDLTFGLDTEEDTGAQALSSRPNSSSQSSMIRQSPDASPSPSERKMGGAPKKRGPPSQSVFSLLYSIPRDKLDIPILEFESRFESGNLHRAICISPIEYDLVLTSDTNSVGHTQWFYFGVRNMRENVRYKFNIINLEKNNSVFNIGMRPCMFSEKHSRDTGLGWFRAVSAEDISYFHNYHRRPHKVDLKKLPTEDVEGKKKVQKKSTKKVGKKKTAKKKGGAGPKKKGGFGAAGDDCYYTLTFTTQFPYSGDTAYLAHFYPFTASYLNKFLETIEDTPEKACFMRRQRLCMTRGGNSVQLLTITNFTAQESEKDVAEMRSRKLCFFSARVHPGETNASWVLKGLVEFLVGNSAYAQALRNKVVFKIIPMLNPDGVIEGNGRCSLEGIDLNRMWHNPSPVLHPSIFHAKRLIRHLVQDRNMLLYCDFHGHSKIKNFVLYGCGLSECDSSCVPVLTKFDVPPADLHSKNEEGAEAEEYVAPPVSAQQVRHVTHSESNMLAVEPHKEKIFPWLLAERAPHLFSLPKSSFRVAKSKAGSARVAVFRDTGISSSYTMEASFCGSDIGNMDTAHFNTSHYEEMGESFGKATLDFWKATERSSFPDADLLAKVESYKDFEPVLSDEKPVLLNGVAPGVPLSADRTTNTVLDDLESVLATVNKVAVTEDSNEAVDATSILLRPLKKKSSSSGMLSDGIARSSRMPKEFSASSSSSPALGLPVRRNSFTDVASAHIMRRVRSANKKKAVANARDAASQRRVMPSIVGVVAKNEKPRARPPPTMSYPHEEPQSSPFTIHRVGLGNLARGRPASFKPPQQQSKRDRKTSSAKVRSSTSSFVAEASNASSSHFGYFMNASTSSTSSSQSISVDRRSIRRSRSNSGPSVMSSLFDQDIPPRPSHPPHKPRYDGL